MIYRIVEMQEKAESYNSYEHVKVNFITAFQNKVNEFLNIGYVPAGGISISQINIANGYGYVHFVQALIKE